MSNETPPASPVPPAPGEERGSNRLALILGVIVALLAVGAAAFFGGKAAADADGAEDRGKRDGREAEAATYASGTPKYQAIYRRGQVAGRAEGTRIGRRQGERQGAERGRRVGFERGERVGELEGEREGIESGANAALGGITGWDVGSFYIVKVVTGSNGVPYSVSQRKEMVDDERYAICAANPNDICTEPAVAAGG
ncbi:MAG TPA: hypothetical protein VNB64_04535 [Solirubrobacteraceae bacterium]|nr:hypothetical protein [Solirubrobacteraceae bacterium]